MTTTQQERVRIEDGPKRVRTYLGGELIADTTATDHGIHPLGSELTPLHLSNRRAGSMSQRSEGTSADATTDWT